MNYLYSKENNFQQFSDIRSICEYGSESILDNVDITITMPIFNHKRFLKEAIESAINQQTQKKFCILIVDNDAKNEFDNRSVIESLNSDKIVYYRNQENIGLVGNWNRCMELAKSNYITYLHDDDILYDYAIEDILKVHDKSGSDFVFIEYDVIDERGNATVFREKREQIYRHMKPYETFFGNVYGTGESALICRDKAICLGGFSKTEMPCLDYSFYSKINFFYGSVKYQRPTYKSRIADNFSFQCYKDIANCNAYIKKQMVKKYWLFSYFLNILIEQGRKHDVEYFEKGFGGKVTSNYEKSSFYNRLLSRIINKLMRIQLYNTSKPVSL